MIPGLILIFCGILCAFLPAGLRKLLMVLGPCVTLLSVASLSPDHVGNVFRVAGFELVPLAVHPFSRIFATVFCIAAFAGAVFGLDHHKPREIAAAFVYAGGALGVVFAGDWMTLFIFWELMAVASTLVVAFGGTENAIRSALRYGYMHFFGGVLLLLGIILHVQLSGSNLIYGLEFSLAELTELFTGDYGALLSAEALSSVAVLLILLGVLVNAGAPPFSAWVADSYPEASPVGTVFLSAFTTKTAVFVLLTVFIGLDLLIYLGLFMIFYGIIYALLENDIRRILAYSVVNQVGFMVTGIGIGTTLAQYGVAAHAFSHIIYKALLFMTAGAVIVQTGGARKCTDLGGLYRTMKYTMICGIIGALSISAFPLTSGFLSKSLITSASAKQEMIWVWFALLAASAAAPLYVGIKFPWFVFFHRDAGLRPKEPPFAMRAGMFIMAALCILPALYPAMLYTLLPGEIGYEPYTLEHVVTKLQLLLFAGLAFFIFLQFTSLLERTDTISLDMDWFYRTLLRHLLLLGEKLAGLVNRLFWQYLTRLRRKLIREFAKLNGPYGILARSWSVGDTVLYSTILLGFFLIIYYVVGS